MSNVDKLSIQKDVVSTQQTGDLFNTTERIKGTHTSELVIALCGPIGSPIHKVSEALQKSLLDEFGYTHCRILKLSDFIRQYTSHDVTSDSKFEEIKELIALGNELREKYRPSILTELAIHEISTDREETAKSKGDEHPGPRRVCHIIDSIKNQEELEILRVVYREMLYFVGVFSPLAIRDSTLGDKGMSTAEIYRLIDQDSGEELDHGQTVRDTFPQADFFLRIDSQTKTQIERKVDRFLDLILGAKVITPTTSETAMYLAASAASNSACLSRQVGAALTDKEGNLLSIGWNDVPKALQGGLYITDMVNDPASDNDKRCWNEPGNCSNDNQKKIITNHVVEELLKKNVITEENKTKAYEILRKNSKLRGLIEFSRSVHAEMHAIINAGRENGGKIQQGKLYCTTYPCHSCARHIIAAGISEVYYIEPYRKSLATRLHGDAITEDEAEKTKVRILPYDGVAPSRYLDLFKVKPDTRKAPNGDALETKRSDAEPRISKTLEALPALEGLVVRGLMKTKLIVDIESNEK